MRILSFFLLALLQTSFAKEFVVTSPDKRLTATLEAGATLALRVQDSSSPIFLVDSLMLGVRGSPLFGTRPAVERTSVRAYDTVVYPAVREKFASLRDRCNELSVVFAGGYGLVVRVYDEGVAYRFQTTLPGNVFIDREYFALSFPETSRVIYQFQQEFWSAYEYPYRSTALGAIPRDGLCNLPLLVDPPAGPRVLLTEAHIEDYPGLWIRQAGGKLRPAFPGYPLEYLDEGKIYTKGKVTKHAEEIARTRGTRSYPWRVFAVGREDADLLRNSLVYLLGEPSRLDDVSWVKPGVVTLDWWARRNLFGVDFAGGINTRTAKYLIDFAAKYGIGYVLLDAGWTKWEDLLSIHPDINIEEIVGYAKGKGIRVLLWAVWSTLVRQWDQAFERFSRWGIDGIKVDFMNRDDQEMVNLYYRMAAETAKRKMLILYHGAYKPDGLRRTYPNVIAREGLIEFEQNQVNHDDSPEYHTILPFIRMVAGPADYLPGTVNNAQKDEFRMVEQRPMGQGTRAHSMALCVLLECPMRMFPDAPPDYEREDPCTRFMAGIPVEWDDLHVVHAKLGEAVVLARRRANDWYVGAITDWDARDLVIDCSFLGIDGSAKPFTVTAFGDGPNSDRRAIDYTMKTFQVTPRDQLRIHLAPGGGWVAKFSRR